MKQIDTIDALGCVLCQDITKIEKGKFKGVLFPKGHVVRAEDIEALLDVGKRHLYVWEDDENLVHENDAAEHIYNLCKTAYVKPTEIKEGKIEAVATVDALFTVDEEQLFRINMQDDIMMATKKSHIGVRKGHKVMGTRIIPLVIPKADLARVDEIVADGPVFTLHPFRHKKVGMVVTGSEVYTGRIEDKFGPTLIEKLAAYDVEILGKTIVDDNEVMIADAIRSFLDRGADLILCSGGMSVDPDDVTPSAIRRTGAEIISYGSPVLPGAMFLVSYYENRIPILGLPGCVMFNARTVFDVLLPCFMADYKVDKAFIARLGAGGLNVKTLME
ncbi:MAG: molybdopterin-binding protein [Eubacteriales bacterium]|nr:molybdopterin-binding protein [Eubacteriales bacterium]